MQAQQPALATTSKTWALAAQPVVCVKFSKMRSGRSWKKGEACLQTPGRARLRQPEPRRGMAPALALSPYERCQVSCGKIY